MFDQNTSAETKIAVLEERLSSYEVLLNKIDEAIQIMGRTSQNISKMLAVHDERIEQCHKADDYIGRLIEELRVENKNSHEAVVNRIEKVESKIEDFVKFRWIVVGIFAVISFGLSQSHLVVDLLSPDSSQVQIQTKK